VVSSQGDDSQSNNWPGHYSHREQVVTGRPIPGDRSDASSREAGFIPAIPPDSLVPPQLSDARHLTVLADARSVSVISVQDVQKRTELTRPDGPDNARVAVICPGPAQSAFCGTTSGTVEFLKQDSAENETYLVGESTLTAIAVNPADGLVLAGDEHGIVSWLEPLHRGPIRKSDGHTAAIVKIRFSPDGSRAASSDEDRNVLIWETRSRSPGPPLPGHRAVVRALAFSSDGQSLATGDDSGAVTLWDVPTRTPRWSWSMASELVRPDLKTREQSSVSSTSHERGISALSFRADGQVLAVGTASGYVQTIDVGRQQPLSAMFHQAPISDLAFDQNTLLVATLREDVFRCWQNSQPPLFLAGHQGSVRFAAVDAKGERAVTGGQDKRLCIWDAQSGSLSHSMENDGESIACGALSSDGRSAVTASYGSGVVFWDLASVKRIGKFYGHKKRVQSLAFSRDGKLVASGDAAGEVRIWDFATRKVKRSIQHAAAVHCAVFAPDNSRLLTTTLDPRGWQFPSEVRLYDLSSGKPLVELNAHQSAVNAALFSADGHTVTTFGADGVICRWNASTGERTAQSGHRLGLSHAGLLDHGKTFAAKRYSSGIVLYDSATLTRVAEFDVPTRHVSDLGSASLGNRLIVGTEEGPAYIWNVGHD
jgi:WD40 repeat protein